MEKGISPIITLRPATIDDLKLLLYWDTQQHVIDCDPSEDWNWEFELGRAPVWREQLVSELQGEPIGFIQIIDPYYEETHYWGMVEPNKRAIDIWIGEEKNLNKGYGSFMMKLAILRCFANPEVTGILVDPLKSNHKAHRFYERLGFEWRQERVFDQSVCYVYELRKMQLALIPQALNKLGILYSTN
ncbi:aminoglycoside 6'-N-acetyltransferase [Dyadobacter jejuensis]|uniref:Aminoglycoside 6'-N-acetyltransferase n=1 Tax=Dyadobacter jejuensis TaxID=1082580 RepID=A0A316APA1_9BACT|nr:GNAT family N-acetyltransferase [Dyadobacter jejuensis]PWJ59308.1 aminoglycoside 6'-N-acetyltransferase [Dyadobacter jejuensis]